MTTPYIIAIAGASCSGKTTIAAELAHSLHDDRTTIIGLDSYYYDLSHLAPEEIHTHNLDEPAALEHTLLLENVAALARGDAIEKPVYGHNSHRRRAEPEHVEPTPFLIIEGLFALYWEALRGYTKTKVFIDATHDLCLQRRITRDRNQRGRTAEEVTHRYRTMVAPMFDRHVLPTRKHADTIIEGADPIDRSTAAILEHISACGGRGRSGSGSTGGGDSGGTGDEAPHDKHRGHPK